MCLTKQLAILVVEDNRGDFELAKEELLERTRYGVSVAKIQRAETVAQALTNISESQPDVILLDSSLPDSVGLSGLEKIKASGCVAPILLLTGMDDEDIAISALQSGAQDYLIKGQQGALHRAIRYAVERFETQKELIIARREAQAANAARGAFLANMSHEIRTPLTAIIGFGETLVENHLNAQERLVSSQAVLRNGRYLLEMINDILDFSKIEAGKVEVEPQACSVETVAKEVVEAMRLKALDKGVELAMINHYPLPVQIRSDPFRLKQILLNLVGNAIKFTSKGQVKVEISADLGTSTVRAAVTDTGIGMSPEQIKNLFQPFVQADVSTTRKFGGTGLGLAISKELAELLNSTIRVESSLGGGSTFTLTIPFGMECNLRSSAYNSEEKVLPEISSSFSETDIYLRGRVLVAEDCEDNRTLFDHLLKRAGVNFEFAENGEIAVAKALSTEFDLVLMDLQMPIMDGYSAATKIHAVKPTLPIVAITASTLKSKRELCFEAGCIDYLRKPFLQLDFFKLLKRYLPKNKEHLTKKISWAQEQNIINANFRKKLPNKLMELKSCLENKDLSTLSALAHRLSGAGLFNLKEIGARAKELETAALNNDTERCSLTLSALEKLIDTCLKNSELPDEMRSESNEVICRDDLSEIH